jgi:hypothetical protein
VRWPAIATHQPATAGEEDIGGLDDVAFDPPWHGKDLTDYPATVALGG